ncbi:MAG: dihydrodipicolinate synthase family protein [Dehalococcoidia bacterium]
MSEFHGIFSPICTPFSPDGEQIDEEKIRRLIDFQLDNGVHGIIPCGGTGEFFALDVDERKRVTEVTVEHVNRRVPVMPHTGACSTKETIELSKHAESLGADALMIVPPYYDVPTEDEVVAHYAAISQAVPLPIMVYSIPAHSKINLTPELLRRLVEIDNVQMLKDSTGDLVQFQRILTELSDKMVIFNGSDTGAFAGLAHGAKGCVWGVANPIPRQCVELYELVVEKQELLKARELWAKLYPLNHFFETEGYAATAKASTRLAGVDIGEPRLPFRPLSEAKRAELKTLLEPLGVLAAPAPAAAS